MGRSAYSFRVCHGAQDQDGLAESVIPAQVEDAHQGKGIQRLSLDTREGGCPAGAFAETLDSRTLKGIFDLRENDRLRKIIPILRVTSHPPKNRPIGPYENGLNARCPHRHDALVLSIGGRDLADCARFDHCVSLCYAYEGLRVD